MERKAKPSKPLVIPKELQKNLPFKDKPKVPKEVRDKVQRGRIAIVREPKERKVRSICLSGVNAVLDGYAGIDLTCRGTIVFCFFFYFEDLLLYFEIEKGKDFLEYMTLYFSFAILAV